MSTRTPGEQFDQAGENLVAILSIEREGQLRGEQAVLRADVVPASLQLAGEIAFAAGELRQRVAQMNSALLSGACDVVREHVHHHGRQHMHAEETQVVAGAQAGHDELLLGLGRSGLFDNLGDLIEALASNDRPGRSQTCS